MIDRVTDPVVHRELAELNRAFYEWVVYQYADAPVGLWSGGVRDYLTYVADLEAECGPADKFVSPGPARAAMQSTGKPATGKLAAATAVGAADAGW